MRALARIVHLVGAFAKRLSTNPQVNRLANGNLKVTYYRLLSQSARTPSSQNARKFYRKVPVDKLIDPHHRKVPVAVHPL